MTQNTKTCPLRDAWTSITSVDNVIRAHVDAVAVNSYGYGTSVGARKTLSL